jgi:CRISPR/Cas system CSM-associated protein Csm4 (group 5 of RAMP superfamily)
MIWNQPDWESTFLGDGFGLSCLFSDGIFLKMVNNVVKFYEDELKRSIEEDFTEKQSYDTSSVSLDLFLPLLMQVEVKLNF